MPQLSAEAIFNLNQEELLKILNSKILTQKKKNIYFYTPSFAHYKIKKPNCSLNTFPTISITGDKCSLSCKHCEGKVLETMHPATTPEKLYSLCAQLKQKGAVGCLISGGCLSDGTVPLKKFAPTIVKIKQEFDLTIFVHTGLIDKETALLLKKAGVDAVLIDVIGCQETIEKTLKLKSAKVKDYAGALKVLQDADLRFVPHIIVGLDRGNLSGELDALQMILQTKPAAIVIIAFMPIRGTKMENVKPPQPIDVARIIACAKVMFPQIPVTLGCMRPKDSLRKETDILAIKAGVDAIAFPSQEVIDYTEKQGFQHSFSAYCCAQIHKDSL